MWDKMLFQSCPQRINPKNPYLKKMQQIKSLQELIDPRIPLSWEMTTIRIKDEEYCLR